MPNDEQEQNRLDIAHEMFRICLGDKLFLAPIGDDPEFILDAGTGTGVWAIEIGDLYPSAKVTGTDLSPTQPTWVPENVQFSVDDAEEVWTYREKFDLVHIRYFAGSITDVSHYHNYRVSMWRERRGKRDSKCMKAGCDECGRIYLPSQDLICMEAVDKSMQWPRLLTQAFENTRPGGFLEIQDFDAGGCSYHEIITLIKIDCCLQTRTLRTPPMRTPST